MDLIQLIPWAIFGAMTIGAWVLIGYFTSKSSRASERLDELRDPSLRNRDVPGNKSGGVGAMLEKAAPTLSKALEPKTELEASVLKV